MNRVILLIVLCLCCLPATTAQTTDARISDTLRQLLSMPAPTPRTAETTEDADKAPRGRPRQFYDKDNVPADDAPLDDLLDYWSRWANNSGGPNPSEQVQQRLLDVCLADPESLSNFLSLLPPTEATAAKLKELYDRESNASEREEYWREKLKKWLLFNSKYFLNDLVAQANKVKDNDKGGYVDEKEALVALAKVDWETAEPLVQTLSNSSQQRTATLALTLIYQRAQTAKDLDAEEKYRVRLKAIAADKNAPAMARDAAIDVLSLTEWSGRDDWYLSLFQDETLVDLSEGSVGFSPLTTLFVRDPNKWIPVMARLVESKDQTVRSAAASCLIIFQNQNARKDALKPLLPWLSDPEWAKDRRSHRLRLVQSMENVDLPESVPGLIWVVEHDDSEYERSYAAESLAKYKDPRAVPALRKALAAEKDEGHRDRIIRGLLACQGLPEPEQLEAIETYAAKLTTTEGRAEIEGYRRYGAKPLAVAVSIGIYLSGMENAEASLVRAVLARAAVLQKTNAPLAQALLEVAHRWQGRQIDLDLVDRIGANTADAATIANALERRAKLREGVAPELQALAASDGPAPGIAAVLLDDPSLAQSVLSSGGQTAQVGLLSCARLTQMPLPVETVGGLMNSKNQLLALAAETYLLAEDSEGARELLWARHPSQAFVTGWRENIETIGGSNFDAMGKAENKLRAELLKEDQLREIFALVANDEQHYSRVLRVYSDKAIYTYYEDPARYRERVATKAELAAFRDFVATHNLPNLGPQFGYCHHDCWSAELLLLTRDKGRRVFSQHGFGGWPDVLANFEALGEGADAKTHYNLEKEIKGLEVLYADDNVVVRDVWQQGAEIRIFVERDATPEEAAEQKSDEAAEQGDDAAKTELRRRETLRQQARFSWRTLTNHQAGEATGQPAGYATLDESKFPVDDDESQSGYRSQVRPISADSIIIARNFYGLWRQAAGQKAVPISGEEGAYADPIVTPDGKWVVVAKTDGSWGEPNYVVRFNLQTGREYRVDLPPAEQFDPVAYLAPHGKVLLRRAKDDYEPSRTGGPETPEYYLLDATTGKAQLTTGAFDPLRQEGKRFLQPTGKANEVWAAITDRAKNQTQVGRYNLKDFTFQPLLLVPHISFDSMAMWVDEAGAKMYLVYEGQLVSLPIPGVPGKQ